ncbi:hypothetical protein BC835DRAFT_1280494 [Cytidiella melzeri]|nr:hypothetical protein BC835DRAFT_1280494 [Cytidiella melzeri]
MFPVNRVLVGQYEEPLLILDEATSAIDYKTDAVIQASLRNEVAKDVTVLTVAHRLRTIMDYDKVVRIRPLLFPVEYGPPAELLKTGEGSFRALVDASGDKDTLYGLVRREEYR